MAGKPELKSEIVEELMEAVSLLKNFGDEEIDKIIVGLNSNEDLDHKNDQIRGEAFGFLLKSIEAYNAKDYEGMQKYIHAAIQKFHDQEMLDFQDDKPRADARIQLSIVRLKTINIQERLTKLTAKFRGKNAGPAKK